MFRLLDFGLVLLDNETFKNVILPILIFLIPISVTLHRIWIGKYSKWWVVMSWLPLAVAVMIVFLALMALGNMH